MKQMHRQDISDDLNDKSAGRGFHVPPPLQSYCSKLFMSS